MNEFKNKSLYIIKSQSSFKGLNWGKKKNSHVSFLPYYINSNNIN